ncbi:MAG TPA: prepilin-type N-terminal cleavage/methylation domain-containing protein [Phycisphaerae bacterium]|nr:prepilin-type N-terminal cleavage/methylation domain-containing protein [Phycisphaerae bacterium]
MNRKNKGFTLVEILIVVIILGILAAIVIPQFTEASNDARVSALVSDLQTVRGQVELYKIQHLDKFPGWNGTNVVAADFLADLTGKTNIDGSTGGTLGPYLQKFPTNPFNTSSDVTVVSTAADPNAVVGGGTTGWWFNDATGNFGCNYADYIDR